MRRCAPALTLCSAIACGSASERPADGAWTADTAGAPDTDAALDTPSPAASTGTWGVRGTLVLLGGAPDPASTALLLAQRTDVGDCELAAAIEAGLPAAAPPDLGLAAAWTLPLAPPDDPTCAWAGPDPLTLGLGPTDPALAPAADRAALPLSAAYGLFAARHDGQLVLLGLAALPDGATPPRDGDALAPPPDGPYALLTAFGVPWGAAPPG